MTSRDRTLLALGLVVLGASVPLLTAAEICWRNWRWLPVVAPGLWWAAVLAVGVAWLAWETMKAEV